MDVEWICEVVYLKEQAQKKRSFTDFVRFNDLVEEIQKSTAHRKCSSPSSFIFKQFLLKKNK